MQRPYVFQILQPTLAPEADLPCGHWVWSMSSKALFVVSLPGTGQSSGWIDPWWDSQDKQIYASCLHDLDFQLWFWKTLRYCSSHHLLYAVGVISIFERPIRWLNCWSAMPRMRIIACRHISKGNDCRSVWPLATPIEMCLHAKYAYGM